VVGDNAVWVPVHGIWARYASMARPAVGHRRRGEVPSAGRWQHAGTRRLYLADSEETAWAEFYRALAERGQPPQDEMPCELIHMRVELARVADLRTEKARRALGLPRLRPTRHQWPPFQNVGERLEAEGAQAIVYASAARTRSLCLCVFEAGLPCLRAAGEPVRVIAPPAPPRGLRT
jgi:RES domain-containing protein